MSISVFSALAASVGAVSLANFVLLALSVGSLVAAWFLGVMPPRRVGGRVRIPDDRSAWPLVAVLFAGLGCYLFADSTIVLILQTRHPDATPAMILALDSTAALRSTIPPMVGLLALLLGDGAVQDLIQQDLGIKPSRFGPGVARGLIGALVVLPPLYLLAQMVELLYQRVHFQHPSEHQLLHVLGEGPHPLVKVSIILGACVVAPLWEELLFRAHLQTLLKRLIRTLISLMARSRDGSSFPPAPKSMPWVEWLVIILTSVLFMAPHERWSWPVIFVLAVCLGYAYERTGNLWVAIIMHASFNTVSTVLFLAGNSSH